MIKWIGILILVAVVAGALGYTGVARAASTGAKILIGILLVIVVVVALLFFGAAGSVF